MTIQLDSVPLIARREADAIGIFMRAVGRAQADLLGETLSFAFAEGDSVSLSGGSLALDVDAARRGRGRHGFSWIYARLVELVESEAVVRPTLHRLTGRGGRAQGVTLPNYNGRVLPGGQYSRLPGPVLEVDVSVATWAYRLDGHGHRVLKPRTDLDIGRTLVHELTSHAWRDISYYQPNPGGGRDAQGAAESRHRASQHGMALRGTPHNFADAEADLIDLYWDIEMERDPGYRQRHHDEPHARHARRIARQVGGVMGTRIVRWQEDTASRRRRAAEVRRERARFLEQRVQFAEAARRAQRQDRAAR